MRKIVIYCDRCGKEFEEWNHKRREKYGVGKIIYNDYDDDDPVMGLQEDLCESCYDELEKWWENPIVEREDK